MKIINYNKKKRSLKYCGLFQVIFILFVMLKIAATAVTVHPLTYSKTLSFQCLLNRCSYRYNILRRTTTPSRRFSLLGQSSSSSSPLPSFNSNSKNSMEDLRIEELLLVFNSNENSMYLQAESLKTFRPAIVTIISLKREPLM